MGYCHRNSICSNTAMEFFVFKSPFNKNNLFNDELLVSVLCLSETVPTTTMHFLMST